LITQLSDPSAYVRDGAAWALWDSVRLGLDIRVAFAALAKALEDEDGDVRRNAVEAFTSAVGKKQDITPPVLLTLVRVCGGTDVYIGMRIGIVLQDVISKYNSLGKLEELQKMIEVSCREWQHAADRRKITENAQMKSAYSKLFIQIAKRKTVLIQEMEGKLLLGEQIRPPKRNRGDGIYRMPVRRALA
jgi:hypothetical protein